MHNMQIANAKRTIAAFISLLTGENVKIKWGFPAACKSTGVIELPHPKVGSAEEIALMTRQAMHEAGHFTETDFDALKDLDRDVMALVNALEDPRMEARQVAKYPGASLMLNRGMEAAFAAITENMTAMQKPDLAMAVTVNTLLQGYIKVAPHEAVRNHSGELLKLSGQIIGEHVQGLIDAATSNLKDCKGTHDVVQLATSLRAALREPPPDLDEEPKGEPDTDAAMDDTENAVPNNETTAPEDEVATDSEPSTTDESSDPEVSADPDPPTAGNSDVETHSDQQSSSAENETAGDEAADTGTQEPSGEHPEKPSEEDAQSTEEDGQSESDEMGTESSNQSSGSSPPGDDSASPDGAQDSPDGAGGQSAGNDLGEPSGGVSDARDDGLGEKQPEAEGSNQGIDMSTQAEQDLGTILQQAYEQVFGAPDVEVAQEGNEATEVSEADLRAVESALQEGEDIDQLLQQVEQNLKQADAELASPAEANDDMAARGGAGGKSSALKASKVDGDMRLTGVVSRLVRVYLTALQDKRRRPMKMAQAGGQIVPSRVWRLSTLGDSKVFRVRKPVGGIDAAATILLDRSGSMEETIVDVAKVALASAQALERISKVKTSIEMFPPTEDSGGSEVLQKFGESSRRIARKCTELTAGKTTPLGEALQEVVPRLLQQRCEKHLLLIITDGMPDDLAFAVREIRAAEAKGIQVICVGMGKYCEPELLHLLTQSNVYIDSVDGLPEAMEKMFKSHVVEKLAA